MTSVPPKTYGDVAASRRSLRSARLSRADIGCTLASPLLALRTRKRPVARSMSSQRSVTKLRGPEAVAVSDQDSRGVPMPRAVLLGGLDAVLFCEMTRQSVQYGQFLSLPQIAPIRSDAADQLAASNISPNAFDTRRAFSTSRRVAS